MFETSRRGLARLFIGMAGTSLIKRDAPTDTVTPPEDEIITGITGQPIPAFRAPTVLLRDLSERNDPEFDDFMLRLPAMLSTARYQTGYGLNERNYVHHQAINPAVRGIAIIMFLRGASEDMLSPILDAIKMQKEFDEQDLPINIQTGEAYDLKGALFASSEHIMAYKSAEQKQSARDLIAVLKSFPKDIEKTEDPKADFNAWLDGIEVEIISKIENEVSKLAISKEKEREQIARGANEDSAFVQPTENNIRLKAAQLLAHVFGSGLKRYNSEIHNLPGSMGRDHRVPFFDIITSRVKIWDPMVWSFRNEQPPALKEGEEIGWYFKIQETGSLKVPLKFEIAAHEIPSMAHRTKRYAAKLEAYAHDDYRWYSLTTSVIKNLKTVYKVNDDPTSAATSKKRSNGFALKTDKMIHAASAVQRALIAIGVDAAKDMWEETIDENAIFQDVELPENASIEDVAIALEHQPVAVFEHEGRVFVVMEQDTEIEPTPEKKLDIA